MIRFLTALLVLLACFCFGQKSPIKYGEIPMEDMQMTVYAADSSAAAVILADYGDSFMEYSKEKGFSITFERITRIKILKKEGLNWGNFSIPLYHSGSNTEKVMGLKGVTYNLENGKITETKLKNESIIREKYDENIDITKVALPKVMVGSIVEISYAVKSDFIANYQDWEFQYTIPVRVSEYRARIPEYFVYEKYLQGYIKLDINESSEITTAINLHEMTQGNSRTDFPRVNNDRIEYQEQKYRWGAKDVPALKEEPFMTTYKDYISKINFELSYTKYPNQPMKNYMGSWAEINNRYVESEDFGGAVNGNGFLKDKVAEMVGSTSSPEEKIQLVHQYVRDNFLWDGMSRKFLNGSIRKVVDDKKGNSAEINLLLASLLEKAGIEVYPVLISTRDHGFVREELPNSTQFNYTICLAKVGDKQILLDATQKLLPAGYLPERCLNNQGLVISKIGHSWVKLASPIKSKTTFSTDLTLAENGTFAGKITIDRSGYHAEQFRRKYFAKGEEEYLKSFANNRPWDLTKSTFENAKQLSSNIKEAHELTINDYVTSGGDRIYFNPFFIEREEANPFKSETREYPIDFGNTFDRVHITKINIPAQYDIEEIPTNKAIALPNSGGRFLFNVNKTNNTIMLTSSLQINRAIFTQEEYGAIRELYTQMIAKQAEQIVLKKK
jgi:hypothetical protein